jgi:hypothetical protein
MNSLNPPKLKASGEELKVSGTKVQGFKHWKLYCGSGIFAAAKRLEASSTFPFVAKIISAKEFRAHYESNVSIL